jgi:predicted TIM-barrel fold metal-dependent hydrolase
VSSPLVAGCSPVIDCHTHIGAVWPDIGVSVSVADAVRMMDRAGIEKACSSTSRFLRFDYREGNRVTLAAVREFPDRILGFCLGDPRRHAECVEEVDRYLGDEGFAGIKLHVSHTHVPYDDPRYDPIYARVEEYHVPVLAHTFSPPEVNSLLNAARAHPEVTFIVGHSGGFAWANHVAEIAAVPNACFDLCCSTNDAGRVEAFVAAAGAERVLFGTDLPLLAPAHDLSQVLSARISEDEKRLILGGNMARILEARR